MQNNIGAIRRCNQKVQNKSVNRNVSEMRVQEGARGCKTVSMKRVLFFLKNSGEPRGVIGILLHLLPLLSVILVEKLLQN